MNRSEAYAQALDYLYSRINYEKTSDQPYNQQHFRLQRMQILLQRLGNPHLRTPVIHIAGTKGKGSVAWLVSETLRRSGYRCGLYTSPHLLGLEERFVVDGLACTASELIELVDHLRPMADQLASEVHGAPTFFELTTAMAWQLFAWRKTNVNVMEVGLGGRLDSTNVCQPELCVITSISLDHQAQLGSTIASIAREKAGIIKPHIPVVSGAAHPDARRVIAEVAHQQQAKLWEWDRDFFYEWSLESNPTETPPPEALTEGPASLLVHGQVAFKWLGDASTHSSRLAYRLGMLGRHQAANASVAIAAVDILRNRGWAIAENALKDSLEKTQVRARLEVRSARPWVVLDAAHNMASIDALIDALQTHFQAAKKTVVFSASRDKDIIGMLGRLSDYFDRIILTQYQSNQRAVTIEQLQAMMRDVLAEPGRKVEVVVSPIPAQAQSLALQNAHPRDLIVATGSFFLVSELLASPTQNDLEESP